MGSGKVRFGCFGEVGRRRVWLGTVGYGVVLYGKDAPVRHASVGFGEVLWGWVWQTLVR